MKVLMLSWEYPPVMYGGLGRHAHALAEALATADHEVTVVTQHAPGAAYDEVVNGVRVVRVPADPPLVPRDDLLAWVLSLNHSLGRAATGVAMQSSFDVVHRVFKGEALAIEAFETRVLVGRHPDDPGRLKSAPVPEEIIAKFTQG